MRRRVFSLVLLTVIAVFLTLFNSYGTEQASATTVPVEIIHPVWTRFEPTSDTWLLEIGALTTQLQGQKAKLESVHIDKQDVSKALDIASDEIPVNQITGLSHSQLKRWITLAQEQSVTRLASAEADELSQLDKMVRQTKDAKGTLIRINTKQLPFAVEEGKTYSVDYTITSGYTTQTFTTDVYITALPNVSGWVSAELHVHSTASDGTVDIPNLRNIYSSKGYRVLYLTDHVDKIPSYSSGGRTGWAAYEYDAGFFSTSAISIYPGVEVTSVHWDGVTLDPYYTDILGYGITGISNLPNKTYSGQVIVNNINGQSQYASAAVAHPNGEPPYWYTQFPIRNYRGLELMSGSLQTNFSNTAPPMNIWRYELQQIISPTSTYLVSARAGGDYHSALTPMRDYVTYIRATSHTDKNGINSALKGGKTTVSQKGGFGILKINNINLPGDRMVASAGASLSFNYSFTPVVSGTYTFWVRDKNGNAVFASPETKYCLANTPYASSISLNKTFAGGVDWYYLHIEGPDAIFSSPIIVVAP